MATIPVSAITMRNLIGVKKAKEEALRMGGTDETLFLGTVLGRVQGASVKVGMAPDGSETQSVVLTGLFRSTVTLGAKGAKPGDEIESTAIFLPGPTPALLAGELEALAKGGVANPEALIALEIHLAAKADGAMIYVVKSMIARQADPFADLAKLAASSGMAQIPHAKQNADVISVGGRVIDADAPENVRVSEEAQALGTEENIGAALAEAIEGEDDAAPSKPSRARK